MSTALRWSIILILILLPLASPVNANSVPDNRLQSKSSTVPPQASPLPVESTTLYQNPTTDPFEIRLQRATFDPLGQPLALSSNLSLAAYPGDGTGYYLVQFHGPILPEWKAALQQTGVMIFDYVPQFAYIVRMNSVAATRIASFDFVRWVGVYQPAFRLSTDLDPVIAAAHSVEQSRITVRAFTGESTAVLLKQLTQLGAQVHAIGADSGGGAIFQLTLPTLAIPDVARLSDVAWIEPWAELEYHNAVARSSKYLNKDGVEARLGLYGAGQIIVDGDSGVSTGNVATMHDDFKGHFYKGTWGGGSCGTWADYNFHGTHTSGSALGNGVRSGAITATHSYAGTNAGIAPEALLWVWAFCSNSSGLPSAGPYNNYFGVMYNDDPRVRINTNSWGFITTAGSYIAFSRETDRFVWNNPDMVIAAVPGTYVVRVHACNAPQGPQPFALVDSAITCFVHNERWLYHNG